jgi:hypothetical protein
MAPLHLHTDSSVLCRLRFTLTSELFQYKSNIESDGRYKEYQVDIDIEVCHISVPIYVPICILNFKGSAG